MSGASYVPLPPPPGSHRRTTNPVRRKKKKVSPPVAAPSQHMYATTHDASAVGSGAMHPFDAETLRRAFQAQRLRIEDLAGENERLKAQMQHALHANQQQQRQQQQQFLQQQFLQQQSPPMGQHSTAGGLADQGLPPIAAGQGDGRAVGDDDDGPGGEDGDDYAVGADETQGGDPYSSPGPYYTARLDQLARKHRDDMEQLRNAHRSEVAALRGQLRAAKAAHAAALASASASASSSASPPAAPAATPSGSPMTPQGAGSRNAAASAVAVASGAAEGHPSYERRTLALLGLVERLTSETATLRERLAATTSERDALLRAVERLGFPGTVDNGAANTAAAETETTANAAMMTCTTGVSTTGVSTRGIATRGITVQHPTPRSVSGTSGGGGKESPGKGKGKGKGGSDDMGAGGPRAVRQTLRPPAGRGMLVMPASLVTLDVAGVSLTVPGKGGKASALSRDMAGKDVKGGKGKGPAGDSSGSDDSDLSISVASASDDDEANDDDDNNDTAGRSNTTAGKKGSGPGPAITISVEPGIAYGPPTGESLRDLLKKK